MNQRSNNNFDKNWNHRILSTGSHIDIQRSDGRVHSAIIRAINRNNSTVSVEWFEKGEAKGKDIDVSAIKHLNPSVTLFEKQVKPRSNSELGRTDDSQHPKKQLRSISHHSNNHSRHADSSLSTTNKHSNGGRSECDINELNSLDFMDTTPNTDSEPFNANTSVSFQNSGDVGNSENISYSLVNSSFGWIKGNSTKSGSKRRCIFPKSEPIDTKGVIIPPILPVTSPSNPTSNNTNSTWKEERKQKQNIKHSTDSSIDNSRQTFQFMIKEFQKKLHIIPLSVQDKIENQQICVCVRKRPLSFKELKSKEIDVITIPNKHQLIVHEPKLKVDLTKYLENQHFKFDYTFNETADNATVYQFTARPLVECIFEGGMATCFAYGQTGSGKTHTMGGEFVSRGVQNYSNGIYAMAAKDVFDILTTKYEQEHYSVQCAYFEIYGGKVFDLLNQKQPLRILEDHNGQVQIVGLKNESVQCVDDVLNLIQSGMNLRTSGQTSANQHSSRSHGVFQLILRKSNKKLWGKFSLIDLAGNERGADLNQCDRITRLEGGEINKSLLALKECIRALGRKATHRPFRASKLTQVLRDSFIGEQSRTCMISMISPGMQSCEHTINTLRYADRVKELSLEMKSSQSDDTTDEMNAETDDLDDEAVGSSDHMTNGDNADVKVQSSCLKPDVVIRPQAKLKSVTEGDGDRASNEEEDECRTIKDSCSEKAHGRTCSSSTYTDVVNDENNNNMQGIGDFVTKFDTGNELGSLEKDNQNKLLEEMNDTNKVQFDQQALLHNEMIEKHRNLIERFDVWVQKYKNIFKLTHDLDFDAAEYSSMLTDTINEQIDEFMKLREKTKLIQSMKQTTVT